VQFGGCFPPVPDEIILSLQAQEDERGFMKSSLVNGWMTPGLKVRVKHGNLDDIEGIFQQITGENRALVLVEILRRQVPMAVPISSLIAA
jgi:transcriptional antiterminator RfaH